MKEFLKNSENQCLLYLFILAISANATISLMGPFFPSEALQKGMNPSLSGAVFAVYATAEVIGSASVGKCLPIFGHRNILLFGILALSVSNIIFGLLHHVNNFIAFSVYCFAIKTFEAFGKAMILITSFALIMKISKEKSAARIGIYHSCTAMGYSVSPVIGTVLYEISGYVLPFIVFGSVTLLHVPFGFICISAKKENKEMKEKSNTNQSVTYVRLLRTPPVLIILLSVFFASFKIGLNIATFELHLLNMKHDHTFIGAMFTANSVMFSLFCVTIGFVADKLNAFHCASVGLIADSIAFFLMGPNVLLNIQPNVYLVCTAMVLFAVAGSLCIVKAMPFMLNEMKENGFEDNETLNSLISGMYSIVYAFGTVFGSIAGGFGMEYFGYQRLSTFCTVLTVVGAIYISMFHVVYSCLWNKNKTEFVSSNKQVAQQI